MSAPSPTSPATQGSPQAELLLVVAAVIAALAFGDSFLEKKEQSEAHKEASQAHANGMALLTQGQPAAAVDALRKAHSLERENLEYGLDLASGLIADEKMNEAEPLINQILQDEPNDGRANLIAARMTSKQGKLIDAEAYYHRAIYGEWPDDAARHRIAARLELVDFLAINSKQKDMLAELLPLEEEAAKVAGLEEKLGHLFLAAGSPSRAAAVFRTLIQQHKEGAAAYAGLGEAELEEGEFHAAHSAFSAASSRNPHDSAIDRDLDLSGRLTALDPSPRWLRSLEKYRRSISILELARDDLDQCVENHPSVATGEASQLLASANDVLERKRPKQATNELSESLLSMAQKLWQVRTKSCGPATSPEEEPLRLIMEKLSK